MRGPPPLGTEASRTQDSFEDRLLGFPVYTRPEEFEGRRVPEVLLSGHHAKVLAWRRRQRLEATWRLRPDLLERAELGPADREFIESLQSGDGNR